MDISPDVRNLIIGAFLGAGLTLCVTLLTDLIKSGKARRTETSDVARLLISEVEFNHKTAKLYSTLHNQISSGQVKDVTGKPLPLDLTQAKILPGTFSFSIFDVTLSKQPYLDKELLDTLHTFYRLLRQAERFRDAAESDKAP